ncbi:MAG: extensin family protein [Paracoccaceae bacterium]|nr:extensin family protein [Paracoccaceae bacterium]
MRVWALLFLLLAGMASAKAPETSLRPEIRPEQAASGTQPVQLQDSGAILAPERSAAANEATLRGNGPRMSLRPQLRTRAVKRAIRKQQRLRAKGAICGDPDIQGESVGRVPGRISGCGVPQAVKVRSVSGITLSQRAVMDCATAQALKTWVDTSVKPAFRKQRGGVKGLRVAAHYACRTRNNKKGARISEHGKGRAIDVSGFQMGDGSTISVLKGWNARDTNQAMRKVHRGACGPFGTVLGPNADSYHLDHFHFDTARYRNGTYCR